MIFMVTGCGPTTQRTPSNASGYCVMAAKVELQPRQRLNRPIVMPRGIAAAARVGQRAGHVAGLEDPAGGDAAVGRAAEAVVAQVVGQHVVPGVMQDLVVRDEVDLDVVTARCPYRPPWLEMARDSRSG